MKICFFCKIDRKDILDIVEFYRQDIAILKKIDPEMQIATRYSEINWNADVIFVWWWTYAFFPVFMARLLRKKVIITGTFNYRCPNAACDYFKRPFWQRWLIKFATKFATKNIFVSENEYNQIKIDWKYKNLMYSPHCIDVQKYAISVAKRKDFLFTICWTGTENIKRKCILEIIDAIDILRKNRNDIHLFIAGHPGNAFSTVKQYIEDKKLNKQISLLGKINEDEKIKYLQSCACYLQPSKYEGFGLAMAEAMSCGAPIISTPVGEVPNVVGDAGILITTPTPEMIASAIENVLSSNTEMLSVKARKRICNLFSMERRESELLQIITIG
jgi:glycosyltransferase involved in cell wall biosynthesis